MYKIVCGSNTCIYSDLKIAIRAYTRAPYIGDHIHIDRCTKHIWEVLGKATEEDCTVYWMREIYRLDYFIEGDFLYCYTGTVNGERVTNIKQYLEDLALSASMEAQRVANQKMLDEIIADRRREALAKVKFMAGQHGGYRLGQLVRYCGHFYEIMEITLTASGFSFEIHERYDSEWRPTTRHNIHIGVRAYDLEPA